MAYSNKFKSALNLVLVSEGVVNGKQGNVDHPDDEGGRTGGGILQTEYDRWRTAKRLPKRDVWDMTADERAAIYHENYWSPMKCEGMPLPIAYMTFDSAVLHGVNFTPKAAQYAIGVRQDGIIGPVTLAAAKAQEPLAAWARFRERRWARMQSRPSFPTFAKGWKKRLDDVERNVRAMVKLPTE